MLIDLVLPIVYWMILSLLPIPGFISNFLILMMAMSVSSTAYVYASIYDRNTSLALQVSILTNILCVVTAYDGTMALKTDIL